MSNVNALYSRTALLTPAHLIGRKSEEGQAFHYSASLGYVVKPVEESGVYTKTMRLARPDFLTSTPRA